MDHFGYWALVPPAVAIISAIVTRKVYLSLGLGIAAAATIFADGNVFQVPLIFGEWVVEALAGNVAVVIFTLLLGALIALMQQSGGMSGFAQWAVGKAATPRRAQFMGWFLGTFIVFIDDYFDTITVGTVMRPITDRQKVSREKLAYIVDTTAAPVAIIAPVSTWVGFIVGEIAKQDAFLQEGAFFTFLYTIPLNFYAITAVLVALLLIVTGTDFGPMRRAEARARRTGELIRPGSTPLQSAELDAAGAETKAPPRMANLVVPLFLLVAVAVVAIWGLGRWSLLAAGATSPGVLDSIRAENGDPLLALVIASGVAVLFAGLYYGYQRIITVDGFFTSLEIGFKSMLPAIIVLTLAWTIGLGIERLQLGDTLSALVEDDAAFVAIPLVIFILSALTAFATGTSFGTFAIMLPLAIPVAAQFDPGLIPLLIAATIGGAVFGDHASPISDTTVLSSMASACDHVDHVRTQLPYAGLAAVLAAVAYLVFGLATDLGLGLVAAGGIAWAVLLVPLLLIFLVLVLRRGIHTDDAETLVVEE